VLLRYGDGLGPWRLEGPDGVSVEIPAHPRLRADNGDAVGDWALAGHGIMLRSEVDVRAHLRSGRLERVLPEWRSPDAPIYALLPSSRHVATKTRVFLDATAARLRAS
jgi:DNA-binding transcriptional LysR family regulator